MDPVLLRQDKSRRQFLLFQVQGLEIQNAFVGEIFC